MGERRRLRSISAALVLALSVSGGAAVAAGAGDAAKKAKKPDLVAQDVTASITGRSVQAAATVVNKASKKKGKKAKASAVGFVLSADTTAGAGDTALGQLGVGKLKPKKSQSVSGTFSVPATVPAGSYYVIACADAGAVVKEKSETNNCAASSARITVPATTPTGSTVTVTYSSSSPLVGTVSATASNGTCAANPATGGGVCTVTAGVGTVTLTATNAPVPFNTYVDGASGPCDGTKAATTVTFTAPAGNKSCVAVFGA